MKRRIVFLCATRRGYLVLERLAALHPECEYLVVSFQEEPWEPPFLSDIETLTRSIGGQFVPARSVSEGNLPPAWRSSEIDLILLVSWRYKLAPAIYERARLGAYVFHDALLPEYRGFSPTVWALINGEDHTGVTLFRISERIDAGEIVDQRRVPIGPDDTIAEVADRVTAAYLQLLERNVAELLAGTASSRPQDERLATYTCKRTPADDRIDWTAPSKRIYDLVRAVTAPYPGAHTRLGERKLRVWSAAVTANTPNYVGRIAGQVCEVTPNGVIVLTGDGALTLKEVQWDDGPRAAAPEVLKTVGQTLGR